MQKKIFFESTVHQFLGAARVIAEAERSASSEKADPWTVFVCSMRSNYVKVGVMEVAWTSPSLGASTFSIEQVHFYTRGDTAEAGSGNNQPE